VRGSSKNWLPLREASPGRAARARRAAGLAGFEDRAADLAACFAVAFADVRRLAGFTRSTSRRTDGRRNVRSSDNRYRIDFERLFAFFARTRLPS
jgi:hypothetical protein